MAARTPPLTQLFSDCLANARPPDGTVIEDRDPFDRPMLGDVVAHFGSLPIVSAAHPEHIRCAFIGQLRAGRDSGRS
jgi:hypothetical protein